MDILVLTKMPILENTIKFIISQLVSLNLSGFNANKVRDMENIFKNCYKLESLDITSIKSNKLINFLQELLYQMQEP